MNKYIEENRNENNYGEFVCSYFVWLPPDFQKEKAKELIKMTQKKNNKRKEHN